MRVTVALSASKNTHISRALFSSLLLCGSNAEPTTRPVRGVFQTKASSPWAGNKSERIQVSMCLPNKRDLDTWYEAVFTLPIAWPDITDIDTHYFKKVSANQLLAIRTQMGVFHMWGEISPQWHLLRKMSRTQSCAVPIGRMVEPGKYQKGVPKYGHYGRCEEFRG